MDRIALSKRIGGLAEVFASGSPIRRELEAMSYALEHMKDEKFAGILSAGYEADTSEEGKEAQGVRGLMPTTPMPKHQFAVSERARKQGPDVPVFEPRNPKAALEALQSDPEIMALIQKKPQLAQALREAGLDVLADLEAPKGNAWSREASDAVIRNLISDVLGREAMEKAICCDTGRKLEKEQMPDAKKKQEKPSTLTEEQTPKLSEALESGMYEKSKGAVRKEAAKKVEEAPAPVEEAPAPVEEAPAPVEEAPKPEEKPVAKQKAEERAEEKVEDTREKATEKAEETADALKKLEKMTPKKASEQPANMIVFDGIELTAPMDEVQLTEDDVRTLGKLFQ
jgi:hypothetical protein